MYKKESCLKERVEMKYLALIGVFCLSFSLQSKSILPISKKSKEKTSLAAVLSIKKKALKNENRKNLKIVLLSDAMKINSKILYKKIHNPISFDLQPYPINIGQEFQPCKGLFSETFVIKIPNGIVASSEGFIIDGDRVIQEFFNQNIPRKYFEKQVEKTCLNQSNIKKVKGRVAVLARVDCHYYGHWVAEMLARLELIRLAQIEFDWLYVPYSIKFIKESLDILGIDPSKVIDAKDKNNFCIQADELIVPSLTVRRIPASGEKSFSHSHNFTTYTPQWVSQFLRNFFLPLACKIDSSNFSDKIFISRKDAHVRRMINEDEVFALFKAKGFKRYELSKMTFLEAIQLFKQAKHVVGAHGSSLTNILFCDPGTKVLEIVQDRYDSSFWNISQVVGLDHTCIQTRWPINYDFNNSIKHTSVPIEIIQKHIAKNL